MGKYSGALPLEPNQGTREIVEQIKRDASKEVSPVVGKKRNKKGCCSNSKAPYFKGPDGRFYRKISSK